MADRILDQLSISVFCSSLSMMLHSGISAQEACALFARDFDSDGAQAARTVSDYMEQGDCFAEAAKKTGAFPEYALGVFQTAEYSGRLEEGLDRLAVYYDRQHNLTQRLRTTLTYPAVLLLMMCGVLAVLVFSVLPMFEKVYTSLTGSLAASSYAYIIAAGMIAKISLVLAVVISAVLLVMAAAANHAGGQEKLRRMLERFAPTRNAFRQLAISKLADTLATLLSSGMDTDSAMPMVLEMTDHEGLRNTLQICIGEMQQGAGLADCLFRNGVFSALYGRMLVGGAESGNLEKTLGELSQRISRDAEDSLIGLMDGAEPLLIGFLAVSVGLTLVSVMLPLLGILGAL